MPRKPRRQKTKLPSSDAAILDRLYRVIVSRRGADPTQSHTARLFARGRAKIAQKFGEESVEAVIEGAHGKRKALVLESADVVYHLLVMWAASGVKPPDVWKELARREGRSGIAEKAARKKPLQTKPRKKKKRYS
jgi:phosphoribosyl-ATP pyrophosphohydrolase